MGGRKEGRDWIAFFLLGWDRRGGRLYLAGAGLMGEGTGSKGFYGFERRGFFPSLANLRFFWKGRRVTGY